jgi:hypothetical protein
MQLLGTSMLVAHILAASVAIAGEAPNFDAAVAFGARPSVADLSLSPDALSAAYVAPAAGQGSIVNTLRLDNVTKISQTMTADGKPMRLKGCHWVSNERLVCSVYGVTRSNMSVDVDLLPFTRLVAVNADGSKLKLLSTKPNFYTRDLALGGGQVVDWMPDSDGSILMSRVYLPDDHLGSRLGSTTTGLGVDLIDTRTLSAKTIEDPDPRAADYLSDGRGTVRIMAMIVRDRSGENTGVLEYLYRKTESRQWLKLGEYNYENKSGFRPAAVDRDLNVAYGFKKLDGRLAVYSLALDGSLTEKLIYASPDVDVDGLVRIGRRNRVGGLF